MKVKGLPKVGGLKSLMPANRILSQARRNPIRMPKMGLKKLKIR